VCMYVCVCLVICSEFASDHRKIVNLLISVINLYSSMHFHTYVPFIEAKDRHQIHMTHVEFCFHRHTHHEHKTRMGTDTDLHTNVVKQTYFTYIDQVHKSTYTHVRKPHNRHHKHVHTSLYNTYPIVHVLSGSV